MNNAGDDHSSFERQRKLKGATTVAGKGPPTCGVGSAHARIPFRLEMSRPSHDDTSSVDASIRPSGALQCEPVNKRVQSAHFASRVCELVGVASTSWSGC